MKKLIAFQNSILLRSLFCGFICLIVFLADAASGSGQPIAYRVVNLGTLPGAHRSGARAINDHGHVVGGVGYPNGTGRPFFYRHGRMIEIPVPPEFAHSGAYAINNEDVVLGCYEDSPDIDREIPFIYRDGVTTPLADYTGVPGFFGSSLNDAGHIAGVVSIPGMNPNQAAVFRDGTLVLYAAPAATLGSHANAINSRSVIAGEATVLLNGNGSSLPFLSFGELAFPLSPLGQPGYIYDINDHNDVVGVSFFPTNSGDPIFRHVVHAALFSGGTVTDLGTLDGTEHSEAHAINNDGIIVGHASIVLGTEYPRELISRAFMYRAGKMVDLNTLIRPNSDWVLEYAFDINNRGQIVGEGKYHGRIRAFLLVPFNRPEPSNSRAHIYSFPNSRRTPL